MIKLEWRTSDCGFFVGITCSFHVPVHALNPLKMSITYLSRWRVSLIEVIQIEV